MVMNGRMTGTSCWQIIWGENRKPLTTLVCPGRAPTILPCPRTHRRDHPRAPRPKDTHLQGWRQEATEPTLTGWRVNRSTNIAAVKGLFRLDRKLVSASVYRRVTRARSRQLEPYRGTRVVSGGGHTSQLARDLLVWQWGLCKPPLFPSSAFPRM